MHLAQVEREAEDVEWPEGHHAEDRVVVVGRRVVAVEWHEVGWHVVAVGGWHVVAEGWHVVVVLHAVLHVAGAGGVVVGVAGPGVGPGVDLVELLGMEDLHQNLPLNQIAK